MEITNEPVRIDYDLMEVVPADHFEARVENGKRVHGGSEQYMISSVESERELKDGVVTLKAIRAIPSPPEESVAVPVVVEG